MFSAETYIERRRILKEKFKRGILLFLGNNDMPMNYSGNQYQFRQDSTFLYYWGLDEPNLAAIIDIEKDREIIFGDNRSVDDIVWMGFDELLTDKVEKVGVKETAPRKKLYTKIKKSKKKKEKIHFLPQYRHDNIMELGYLLCIDCMKINSKASIKFVKSVIEQRSIKSEEEVMEIEKALDISYEMYKTAMKKTKPGVVEREISGILEGIASSKGSGISFPIIFSINGEILHNHSHENTMKEGDIAVLDSGAESSLHYASDITRTIPVSGKFSDKQKNIYNIVLESQLKAIEMIKPGIKFKEIHLEAAKVIAKGLTELGLMKGDFEKAVEKGAHALFFPHGLGHMMGLDVHDMEGLGENYVGYTKNIKRSDQFGLAYLRLAKELEPGYVLTVEPGIYFIPQLIRSWKAKNKHSKFINYDLLEDYLDFGGIRIEEDVLVTEEGCRVLGKQIPKTVEEVEKACS